MLLFGNVDVRAGSCSRTESTLGRKTRSRASPLKVHDFCPACRRSSRSLAFLGFQRCDVPGDRAPAAGEPGLHSSALGARPRGWRAPTARPPRTHSWPAQRAPRALSASWPLAQRSRAPGGGARPAAPARPLPPGSFLRPPGRSRFLGLGLSRRLKFCTTSRRCPARWPQGRAS